MLLCAPTERPPPTRAASASVITTAAPTASPQMAKRSRFMIDPPGTVGSLYGGHAISFQPLYRPALQTITPVHRHHFGSKVKELDLRKPCLLHHRREGCLVRMHPDRFGEV